MTIQGAISEIENMIFNNDIPTYYNPVLAKVAETIRMEFKQRTGHWIFDGFTKCSECGYKPKLNGGWNYCPICGAKMVEPQESEVSE